MPKGTFVFTVTGGTILAITLHAVTPPHEHEPWVPTVHIHQEAPANPFPFEHQMPAGATGSLWIPGRNR
jgi:hypothetical protein